MSCVQIPHRPPPRGGAACGEASFSQHLWDWLAYRGAALSGYDGSCDDWWSGSWLWSNYAFAVHDTGYTGPWGRWRDNGGYEEWIEYRIAVYGDGCAGTWDDWMADTGLVYPDPAAPAAFPYDEMTAWVTQARQAAVHVDFPPVIFTVNSAPRHDADGNQTIVRTSTGVWHVSYNADNRPVCYSNDTAVVTLGYDYLGRCFRRAVSEWSPASSEFPVSSFQRYLYRGYLRIAALDMLDNAAVIHTAVWDPTEPAATRPFLLQTPSGWYTYSFDQVKNVTELFDSSGSIAGTYDFGPFSETLSASGSAAALNPFRFSSEVWDNILGLAQYNYRPYNPLEGHFITRDPIEEEGGLNLYGFVENDPVNRWDCLGLKLSGPEKIVLYAKTANNRCNHVTFTETSKKKVCKWKADGNIAIHKKNKTSATVSPTAASGTVGDSKITAVYYGGGEDSVSTTVIYPKHLTRAFPGSSLANHFFRAEFRLVVTIFDQFGNAFPQGVAVNEDVRRTASGFFNVAQGMSGATTNARGEVSDTFGATLSRRADLGSYVNFYQEIKIGEWSAVVVSQMLYSDTVGDGIEIGHLVKFNGMSKANFH
jgi:RHS repeat-associated protein